MKVKSIAFILLFILFVVSLVLFISKKAEPQPIKLAPLQTTTTIAVKSKFPTPTVEPTVTVKPKPRLTKEQKFVKKWTPRLNKYFKGTPLAGQGKEFAKAAYKNDIDPRLSAAISCVESSKGRHCFRSHNAWGWMGQSFSSWKTAIHAHAAYLDRMYWGGDFSLRMAKRYCPPTYRDWYGKVKSEMSKI